VPSCARISSNSVLHAVTELTRDLGPVALNPASLSNPWMSLERGSLSAVPAPENGANISMRRLESISVVSDIVLCVRSDVHFDRDSG